MGMFGNAMLNSSRFRAQLNLDRDSHARVYSCLTRSAFQLTTTMLLASITDNTAMGCFVHQSLAGGYVPCLYLLDLLKNLCCPYAPVQTSLAKSRRGKLVEQ